eukprot:sb/3462359/
MVLEKTEAPYDKTERMKHQQLTAFTEKVREVLEKNEKIAKTVNIKILSDSERYSFEQDLRHFQKNKERFYQCGIVLWCVNISAGLLACVLEEWITEIAMIAIWAILLVIMGSYIMGCRVWAREEVDYHDNTALSLSGKKLVNQSQMSKSEESVYISFGEQCLQNALSLYNGRHTNTYVVAAHTMEHVIKMIRGPLGLKYACPAQSTWLLCHSTLLSVVKNGVSTACEQGEKFEGMWREFGKCLEEFLFGDHRPPINLSYEERVAHEQLDVSLISLIQDVILPRAGNTPVPFVKHVMNLLNRGSVHATAPQPLTTAELYNPIPAMLRATDPEALNTLPLREQFAKACFETLLQFSFYEASSGPQGDVSKMALGTLLKRCQEVLKNYVKDEKLSGRCPLPRSRMAEIAFVMRAISSLINSLQARRDKMTDIDVEVWNHVVELYPFLIDCITCNSNEVRETLKEALHQFKDLLIRGPLGLKYACPAQSTWLLCHSTLLSVVKNGVSTACEQGEKFEGMWREFGKCLEEFLFGDHRPPINLSYDERVAHEQLDVSLISLIQDVILPRAGNTPVPFVKHVMNLLNRGSVHATAPQPLTTAELYNPIPAMLRATDPEALNTLPLREQFAKACFETLLQFSFYEASSGPQGDVSKMALGTLLKRCQEVLKNYVKDEKLSGRCPLPRSRMAEIAFVMRAISSLINSLQARRDKMTDIDVEVWNHVVELYPFLIDCITCNSNEVRETLKEALHQFKDLLVAPSPR